MTDKQKLREAEILLDANSARIMVEGITEQSNEEYLKLLDNIYTIETETIFKNVGKRERCVSK
jgi:hypothetical protein